MEGCDGAGIAEGGEGNYGRQSRGEIGGEAGEVTGVAADTPNTDGLGERYGIFSSGWGMAAGKVEVLLVVGGFDMDGGRSFLKQDQMEEDLEEDPGLHTRNAWGGKYPKAWRNLKEWLKTEKKFNSFTEDPRH